MKKLETKTEFPKLTNRELEIIDYLSTAKTYDEIAQILLISSRTVKAHVCNIKSKLGCYSLFQLGMYYSLRRL